MLYQWYSLLIFIIIFTGAALNIQYNTVANASYDQQVGTSESDNSNFLEYRGHGIRFEYPDSWINGYQSKFANRDREPTILPYEIFHSHPPSSLFENYRTVEFSVFEVPAVNKTLNDTLESYTKILSTNPKLFKQMGVYNVSFGNQDGYGALVEDRTIPDFIRNVAEVWAIKNDKQYLFVFSYGPASSWGDNRFGSQGQVFRHILESVKFDNLVIH